MLLQLLYLSFRLRSFSSHFALSSNGPSSSLADLQPQKLPVVMAPKQSGQAKQEGGAADNAAPAAAPAPALSPEVGLTCQKCAQATTVKDSLPNGRNQLRRNCLECVATDKALGRSCKKPKENQVESECQRERRENAEATKASLQKMSVAERNQWYCKQKEERKAQERTTKRTFSTGVGFAQETETQSLAEHENDVFETSDMWCSRQLSLKKFDNLADAQSAFRLECGKPGARTMTRRGETLLATFAGVVVAAGKEHSLSCGVRQRCDLTEAADLKDFQDEVENKTSMAKWRLESDRQALLEGTLNAATPPLNVAKDIDRARAAELALEQSWMESLEQQAASAESSKAEKVAKVLQSVSVEAMGLEAAIERNSQSMNDALARQKAMMVGCEEQTDQLETELMRDESKEHHEKVSELLPQVVSEIEGVRQAWIGKKEKAVADKDAEVIHNTSLEVAKDLKDWLSNGDKFSSFKAAIKDWKQFLSKCKASANKKIKAATKNQSMAGAKLATGSSWHQLGLCKQAMDALNNQPELWGDQGISWSLDKDLLNAPAEKECGPVVWTEAQAKPCCKDMMENEYYKFQKVWVQEQMKKLGAGCFLSAQITKAVVSKKITALWNKLCSSDVVTNMLKACSDTVVKELFVPQFFQQSPDSCQVHLHTDFGLPDARLLFEGEAVLMGLPLAKVPGDSLADKRAWLHDATWNTFVAAKTWTVHLVPNKGVVIPGDHCFLCAAMADNHGGRSHLLLQGHSKRTMKLCEDQVSDNAALQGLKTGKLLAALKELGEQVEADVAEPSEPPAKKRRATPAPAAATPKLAATAKSSAANSVRAAAAKAKADERMGA
eukprot:s85_g12.t1